MKLLIKSVLFYVCFIIATLLFIPFLIVGLYFIKDRRLAQCIAKVWTQFTFALMKRTIGLTYRVEGFEQIHQSKTPVIIASKHQSMCEAGILQMEFGENSVFVIKKDLKRIPLFGRIMTLMGMIAIDRKKPVQAIRQLLTEAKAEVEQNHSNIIIFPEGRRTAVGETGDYTDGVYLLYKNLNLPVAAIAVNSGLYWPHHRIVKYPGVVNAKVVAMIPPGLTRDQFRDRLVTAIESGSLELITSHRPDEFSDVLSPSRSVGSTIR